MTAHTTGPLAPGPPSVPMGPFEQKKKKKLHQYDKGHADIDNLPTNMLYSIWDF